MANLSLTREFGRIFTSTMVDVTPLIWDNISTRIPLIHWLYQQGQVEMSAGGAAFMRNIYKQSITAVGFTGTTKVTPLVPDPFTRVEYVWKNVAVPFKVPGTDLLKNSGPTQVFDLIEAIVEVAENSGVEALGGSTYGVFSSADETDETAVTGLQNILTTSNTAGTVGKLSRATNTFWRHQIGTAITDFSSHGLTRWRGLLLSTKRGNENTDAIVTTSTAYSNFLGSATGTLRFDQPLISPGGRIDVGVPEVFFHGALVMPDDNCPTNMTYALMSKYLKLRIHEQANFSLREFVLTEDEYAISSMIIWSGNLVATSLARLGIIEGSEGD